MLKSVSLWSKHHLPRNFVLTFFIGSVPNIFLICWAHFLKIEMRLLLALVLLLAVASALASTTAPADNPATAPTNAPAEPPAVSPAQAPGLTVVAT